MSNLKPDLRRVRYRISSSAKDFSHRGLFHEFISQTNRYGDPIIGYSTANEIFALIEDIDSGECKLIRIDNFKFTN